MSQKQPVLLVGHNRQVRVDDDGRDVSAMIPCVSEYECIDEQNIEGRALKTENGRTMVMAYSLLPPGMVGGGVFDVYGNCKGMIEGIVQKPGANLVGCCMNE